MPDSPVLAIALDSADAPLARDLIARGDLPTLAALERQGRWGEIRSPAVLGAGSPWPTFFTGTPPEEHHVNSPWRWDAAAMEAVPEDSSRLRPFWAPPYDGPAVGVLDVPFAAPAGVDRGFEVSEWGAHDRLRGRTAVTPAALAPEIVETHPLSSPQLHSNHEDDRLDASELLTACITGAGQRTRLAERLIRRAQPDLAIVVFSEIHHCAHELWHTAEPGHPLFEDMEGHEPGDLLDVYREVDRQVGRLVDAVAGDSPVVAFALHGMMPARGLADVLPPVLTGLGYTVPPAGASRSRTDMARSALASLKRRTPHTLKRLYNRNVPAGIRYRLAQPTMMAPIDWSRTRAFALPSDQFGYVRVNLHGREAQGAVAREDYGRLRDELIQELSRLETEDGEPLVSEVIPVGSDDSPPPILPDLVVHWTDAALANPVRVREPRVTATPTTMRATGQHRPEGFFLARGFDPSPPPSLDAVELKDFLVRAAA